MSLRAWNFSNHRSFYGLLIGALITVAYALIWLLERPPNAPIDRYIGFILGVEAVQFMSWSLVLATVLPFQETAFGGLDRQAIWHRRTALVGVALALVHSFLTWPGKNATSLGSTLGNIGLYGLLALILWALVSPTSRFARWGGPLGWLARIPYDSWRSAHRLTGVFVILAMVHGFLEFPPRLLQSPLVIITYLLICAVSIGTFLYRELLMRYFLPRTEYSVGAVERPDARTLVVDLEPRGEPLAFAPGQFVYVNFGSDSWRPHPFTVASGSSARRLQLAIRASGDETRRLYEVLQPGVTAVVAGPHGRFDYRRGGARQVWIAAGIGVTPFISWIRSLDSSFDREVDLLYVVPNEYDAPFLEEVKEAAEQQPSLRVHLVPSQREGRLTPDQVARVVQTPLDEVWIYMCGPAQMMRTFERRFGQLGVRRSRIFWEHFELR